ncbi:MAG TPA: amidohydrolase [Alcaligenaceae bacterium]|nr:amidohydrolase [Alcaligenaceae bacterium]
MTTLPPLTDWQDEFIAIRRDLHQYPELGYEEFRTSDKVAELLQSWGIPIHRGLGETGVVGILQGKLGPGKSIGLRADMDALPMPEQNAFPHKSRHEGKMHACGHDGHTTMLLAAAKYLASHNDFAGTVYFIFQPAEEGLGGAKKMIEDGLFTNFPMDAVFGIHNWPHMPTGHFGLRAGAIMASSNSFAIKVQGKGAHGAMPHLGADPVMAAVHIAQGIQSIVSRNMDPLDQAVVSITQIHAGSADNVIPDTAQIRGTVRTFSTATLDIIEQRLEQISQHSATALGCSAEMTFTRTYPPTINHADAAQFCADLITDWLGADHLIDPVTPSMGAEDFSFMLEQVPGCYLFLGNGDGDHRAAGHGLGPCSLHNGSYDFNDNLIPIGASFWVKLATQWLQQP